MDKHRRNADLPGHTILLDAQPADWGEASVSVQTIRDVFELADDAAVCVVDLDGQKREAGRDEEFDLRTRVRFTTK
jgi:hypothetical protein